MNQQLSLFEWRPPVKASVAAPLVPTIIHEHEFCARCRIFQRPMCVSCQNKAAAEVVEEPQKPLSPEEIAKYLSLDFKDH